MVCLVISKSAAVIPLTKPFTYDTFDGTYDKDGLPIATPHVITPDGKKTANDAFDAYLDGQAQLVRMMQKTHMDMTLKEQKSKIGEQNASSQGLGRCASF